MDIVTNPFRGTGMDAPALADMPWPSQDAEAPAALLQRCPRAGATPLVVSPALAAAAGVAELWIKDERDRMGMGSFKALGAAYVIACDAENGRAQGRTYVAASAGNHGLSVAAGAAAFGAHSVIYLSQEVPEAFAARLRTEGAKVLRDGATYEASMQAAQQAADREGWDLLSDSSWDGYTARPHRLMEGYLVLMQEAIDEMKTAPTHIFLQAGVGGLAAACAGLARAAWGDAPRIVIVEPEAAPALINSIRAGAPVETDGPVSDMGRLDCKIPSLIALKGLARDADDFMTITEAEGHAGANSCAAEGLKTTPSGAAGLSGLLAAGTHLGLTPQSRVLAILSEGPEA
jgi:diaminopropionate ammonia-lyase